MDTFSTVVFLVLVAASVVSSSADAVYGDGRPASLSEIPYKIKEKKISKPIAVQGLIYCKSGDKFIPLKGILHQLCIMVNVLYTTY